MWYLLSNWQNEAAGLSYTCRALKNGSFKNPLTLSNNRLGSNYEEVIGDGSASTEERVHFSRVKILWYGYIKIFIIYEKSGI